MGASANAQSDGFSIQIEPLYYTTVDSLSGSYEQPVFLTNTTIDHGHSAVTTRNGIYCICQTEDDYNKGWALYLLPESAGVYESPFRDMILGDADGDGSVTIADVTVLQRYLTEMDAPQGIGKPITSQPHS